MFSPNETDCDTYVLDIYNVYFVGDVIHFKVKCTSPLAPLCNILPFLRAENNIFQSGV